MHKTQLINEEERRRKWLACTHLTNVVFRVAYGLPYLLEEHRHMHDEESGHRERQLLQHVHRREPARLILQPLETSLHLKLHEFQPEIGGVSFCEMT